MYKYKGFMLDSARHMQPIDEIKKLIDAISELGFNKFHWHLTDDQGWRFECEKYPMLNTDAAERPYSDFGKVYDNKPYGRVYTKEEMREVVSYCAEKGIDVVPEFDMPGHTSALLSVMPELCCKKKDVKIKTHQGIYNDVLCPAKSNIYEILFNIIDEFCEIFPSEYFHIGGDETPSKHWESCPDCRKKMKELGITDFAEYQNHFMNRIIDYLEKKGRHVIVWNDAARGKNLDKRAIIQYWKENDKASIEYINSGGMAILSPFSYYYFDYDYMITPLNRTYSFSPELKGLTQSGKKNIIGLEAPVWTEYINSSSRLEKLLFPRLIAVSFTLNGKGNMKYKDFLKEIENIRKKLDFVEFEDNKKWTSSRMKTPLGWLKFVKTNYSYEYIKSATNQE